MRVQVNRIRTIPALVAGIAAAVFTVVPRGADFAVTVKVGATLATCDTDICGDNGKIKVFKDVDDFIKSASKVGAFASTFTPAFANVVALEPRPFTGDIIKRAQAQILSFNKQRTTALETAAVYATELNLMPNGTLAEQALKAEKQNQKDAVDSLAAWLAAEVVRLTAIITPVP